MLKNVHFIGIFAGEFVYLRGLFRKNLEWEGKSILVVCLQSFCLNFKIYKISTIENIKVFFEVDLI